MRRTQLGLVAALVAAVLLASIPSWVSPTLQAQLSATGAYFLPPTACGGTASGNTTGTQGYQVNGASNTWVQQVQTSITGTNTHTYICDITPIGARLGGGAPTAIVNAVFYYGQLANWGTQVSTLASGTFNSSTVFSKILLPTPGIGETGSTVTPARADAGNLLITPAVINFNGTTTTAGQYFSIQFTPAAAIVIADNTKYLLTVTFQLAGNTAQTSNTPGVLVHTR